MISVHNKSSSRFTAVDITFIFISIINFLLFIVSSAIFYQESMFSCCARLLLLLNLFLFCVLSLHVFQNKKTIQLSYILLIATAISIFISYFLNPDGNVIEFLIRLCGYLSIPIYMITVQQFSLSSKMESWFKFISIAYALLFFGAAFYCPTYYPVSGALTIGFPNANTAGAIFLLNIIFVIIAFANSVNKLQRWISYTIIGGLLYLILLSQCRSAFLLSLVCFAYILLPVSFRPGKYYICLCFCSSYIFYYFYTYLFESGWNIDATLLDRPIYSGRQQAFVEYGLEYTFFGDFSIDGLNLAATLINALGLIGTFWLMACYMSILFSPFFQDLHDLNNCRKNLSLFCLGILFVHGCVEVAFFTAGSFFGSMIGCILAAIACNRKNILISSRTEGRT